MTEFRTVKKKGSTQDLNKGEPGKFKREENREGRKQ